MPFKFFTIPIQNAETAETQLNAFVQSHRVLAVDRRWVDQGATSFWSFCVDYLEPRPESGPASSTGGRRTKVDYKEVLTAEEFAVFARLRELRKQLAQAEAVPVYTIFTNGQLAQMVQSRAATKEALEKIAGVGDARIEKYGTHVLDLLRRSTGTAPMKRVGNLFEQVVDRDNLRLAFARASRGKTWRQEVRQFATRLKRA